MSARPDLHDKRFMAVVIVTEPRFHTPLITFLRQTFGEDAAHSAFGYGYRQYEAIAVAAKPIQVLAKVGDRNGVKSVRSFRI